MNFNPGGIETKTRKTLFLPGGAQPESTIVGPEGARHQVVWVDVDYPEPHTGRDNIIGIWGQRLTDEGQPTGKIFELAYFPQRAALIRRVLDYMGLSK